MSISATTVSSTTAQPRASTIALPAELTAALAALAAAEQHSLNGFVALLVNEALTQRLSRAARC